MSERTAGGPVAVLMVCLGNICRSPTAEAALRAELASRGLDGHVVVDSAGTGSWHVGDPPDRRMQRAASAHGLELDGLARTVGPDDLEAFDLVLAMDASNEAELRAMARDADARGRIARFRAFDPDAPDPDAEVPDPYHGGEEGFHEVVRICRRTAAGLADHLAERVAGSAPHR